MLKIKDDVDLKELEKFGFGDLNIKAPLNKCFSSKIHHRATIGKNLGNADYNCRCYISNRIIEFCGDEEAISEYGLNLLFDLIQAGLVEKVSD